MNITLHHKMIKEMCGTVSFKRGDSFYKTGKVTFANYRQDRCEATVAGAEDFHVTIETGENGSFQTSCTCPSLSSVKYDCQHIAAVLLAIYEHQCYGTTPSSVPRDSTKQLPAERLFYLFDEKPSRSSGHQLHFENRQILDAAFSGKLVPIGRGHYLFGIEVKIGQTKVQHIREFLADVRDGNQSILSTSFTYSPKLHCFQKETDNVIQQLIQVMHDENVYLDTVAESPFSSTQLLIPPSSWKHLLPLLEKAPSVKLEYSGMIYDGICLTGGPLPLEFVLAESEGRGFQLIITGLNLLVILESYHSVLVNGKILKLEEADCKRLVEFKQMLEVTGTNQILISQEHIDFFLEKVVPGLRKIGQVHIPAIIKKQNLKTPLTAKLFLDRVKNRLLAGLEFHYDNIVINPLEDREIHSGIMLIRDVEKENEILQIMKDSSFANTDSGYYLHNEELEYEFLYHMVPKLQKLVRIYATTAVRNRIFRENSFPKISIKVKKERTNWLEFKFEMDGISDKQIRELLQALEEKRKYYRLPNGSLLSLESREYEEIQRFLKAVPAQAEHLESGLDMPIISGIKMLDSIEDSQAFRAEDSFRQFLENIRNPDRLDFAVPKSVEDILRDYQAHGYKWMKTLALYGFGGILADDMGLGKTLQSITFILSEIGQVREKDLPVLIVCPSSLTYNWLSEIRKFAPDVQAVVVDGKQTERKAKQMNLKDIDVVITSYPLLRKDILWYEKQSFHTVFFDEAQVFKNPLTQTAKTVKIIQADHRFALTGTPVENSLEELWSIFHVVFPELFSGLKEYSHLSKKTIARRIRPFLLRRLKEDVLSELPEKIESVDSIELHQEQKRLYAAYLAKLRHDTLKHLNKDTLRKNRIKILAGLTRLRQICCHPALFVEGYKGSSAKFEQLLAIVDEAKQSGRRVLIFSQFTKMLELIGRELAYKGLSFFYLDGQTPSEERVEICNQFNDGERDFFLISLKAGGTGLNLTGADTVILYDLWWNPAVEEQAADRAHRIGQTSQVQVIKLLARGTIEEKINELQEKKRNLIEEIIDSKENGVSALTDEDIREILMI